MMRDDGGSAFPIPGSDGYNAFEPGMSLRDWFAGQALAGYLVECANPGAHALEVARTAYRLADAMLEARK